jgi:sugar fermentation stimulation protein A
MNHGGHSVKFQTSLVQGKLLRRYKRFFADVLLADGQEVTAHCPNTGSMMGCCEPGSSAYVSNHHRPSRKLAYTLEIVGVGNSLVGVNTSLTNRLVEEALLAGKIQELQGYPEIKREISIGDSRLDLLLSDEDRRCYVEVKNVTLGQSKVAYFPDAVTTRGTKHLRLLQQLKTKGHRAVICYVVQREDCRIFTPADHLDPVYGQVLRQACQKGVEILVYQAKVTPQEIAITHSLPFRL